METLFVYLKTPKGYNMGTITAICLLSQLFPTCDITYVDRVITCEKMVVIYSSDDFDNGVFLESIDGDVPILHMINISTGQPPSLSHPNQHFYHIKEKDRILENLKN